MPCESLRFFFHGATCCKGELLLECISTSVVWECVLQNSTILPLQDTFIMLMMMMMMRQCAWCFQRAQQKTGLCSKQLTFSDIWQRETTLGGEGGKGTRGKYEGDRSVIRPHPHMNPNINKQKAIQFNQLVFSVLLVFFQALMQIALKRISSFVAL